MSLDYVRSLASKYREARLEGIDDFLEEYGAVLRRNREVPIFTNTEKYKSFPKKHFKKGTKKGSTVVVRGRHRLFEPKSDLERIQQVVRGTLNKINESNFMSQIDSLKRSLSAFNSVETLDILAREVVGKIIFEHKFQDIYAQLCREVNAMQDWQDQLVTVVENDGELYWAKNYGEEQEDTILTGPFSTEEELRESTRRSVRFSHSLLEGLKGEFEKRDQYWEEVTRSEDEVEQYRTKRNVLAPLEFLVKLAARGDIPEAIFHYITLRSLGPEEPTENGLESFLHIWREADREKFQPKYMRVYRSMVDDLIARGGWSNRIRFMLEDRVGLKAPAYRPPGARSSAPTPGTPLPPTSKSTPSVGTPLEDRLRTYFKGGQFVEVEGESIAREVILCTLDYPERLERAVELLCGRGDVESVISEFEGELAELKMDFPKAETVLVELREGLL